MPDPDQASPFTSEGRSLHASVRHRGNDDDLHHGCRARQPHRGNADRVGYHTCRNDRGYYPRHQHSHVRYVHEPRQPSGRRGHRCRARGADTPALRARYWRTVDSRVCICSDRRPPVRAHYVDMPVHVGRDDLRGRPRTATWYGDIKFSPNRPGTSVAFGRHQSLSCGLLTRVSTSANSSWIVSSLAWLSQARTIALPILVSASTASARDRAKAGWSVASLASSE